MPASALPHIISFYAGDRYYYESAELLKEDCRRLDIPHNIVELQLPDDFDWGTICRKKVEFYRDQVRELGGPVMWVDVDSRLLRAPELLRGCAFDIVGYARHNRYIRDYDRYFSSRFWMPQVLYFNATERARRFLDHLVAVERASEISGSDDYFMQEAWASFPEMMAVGFLPPQTLAMKEADVNEETIVRFQASGNVSKFVKTMEQHTPPYLTPGFRKLVFESAASEAQLQGDRDEAAVMLRRAFRIDRSDSTCALKLAEVVRAAEGLDAYVEVLDEHQATQADDITATKRIVNALLSHGRLDDAESRLARLAVSTVPGSSEFAASRSFRLSLERRAQALGIHTARRPAVWWMETPYPGNFGDILNPYVIEKVSGLPPRFAPRGAGMLAIGSIIKFAQSGTEVWGSGTPRMSDVLAPDARYRAVRGPLTQQLVRNSGGQAPAVTGDPALLLPRYYTPRDTGTRYRLGFIPHVCHLGHEFEVADDVLVVSPSLVGYEGIERFIDQVASCERILSTSLHGVIVANAYGVPARWCHFGENAPALAGDGTKFEDYFRSVGLPVQTPEDLSGYSVIDETLRRLVDAAVDVRFDAEALLDAYPWERTAWAAGAAGQPAPEALDGTDWRDLLTWAMVDAGRMNEAIGESLMRRVNENPSSLRVYLKEMNSRGLLDLIESFSRAGVLARGRAFQREAALLQESGAEAAARRIFQALEQVSDFRATRASNRR